MAYRHRNAFATFESEECFANPTEALRLIAFYLPQFYPFPENDAWWGKGFTEWHNVVTGSALYEGHDQPRLPADLGYYDLRVEKVFREQIAMAKRHGIYGFCFHHYWFDGKRLMDMPVERLLADDSLDMPFCLSWANENWTRRWDGEDNDILISQRHSPEDDIAFIADVARYMKDPRYIRVDGKPILLVYRVQILPDAKATAQRWRRWCQENGIGEIHLVMAHPFVFTDNPDFWGYDAAVEFPPHMPGLDSIRACKQNIPEFSGHLYDYSAMADSFMKKTSLDFTLYKCVTLGWDNTARRRASATILTDFTPDAYADWLNRAIQHTKNTLMPSKRLLFINAWNEWAEGAYLEPDMRWGYACLNRTSQCLNASTDSIMHPLKILVVSHDTNVGGAQVLLLSLLARIRQHISLEIHVAALTGGNIRDRFEAQGPLLILDENLPSGASRFEGDMALRAFCGGYPDVVLANTAVSGKLYDIASLQGIPIVTYVHEQEQSLLHFAGEKAWQAVANRSCAILTASPAIFHNLLRRNISLETLCPLNAFIEPCIDEEIFLNVGPGANSTNRSVYRKQMGLAETGILVFGCGTLDWRKGPDLFFETAIELRRQGFTQFHFYWIGIASSAGSDELLEGFLASEFADCVHFLGLQPNPTDYLIAGDIFFLSSREDPFPLAALEGAQCGLPLLCFAGSGGIASLVDPQEIGAAVEGFAPSAAASMCIQWMDKTTRLALGKKGRQIVLSEHTTQNAVPCAIHSLRKAAGHPPSVSVIVPNFNYGRYLRQRIDSILAQTHQDMEIIILDDGSTDDSLSIIECYAHIPFVRVVRNTVNSGSVFAQWKKGLELARSGIIWIAEADDTCTPNFLETLLPAFRDPSIALATCASKVIDAHDIDMGFDYRDLPYMTQLSSDRWYSDYICTGQEEVFHGMGSRNTIFNASSVLFRKPALAILDDSLSYTMSGDWLFYLNILKKSSLAYFAKAMNMHRRHDASVAAKVDASFDDLLQEFWRVHSWVIKEYDPPKRLREQMVDFMRTIILPLFPNKTENDLMVFYDLTAIISK